jgi:hypothetical protein
VLVSIIIDGRASGIALFKCLMDNADLQKRTQAVKRGSVSEIFRLFLFCGD